MTSPFEYIIRDHGPRILRVCKAVLGSWHDAEDAWSETFIALLEKWDILPDETNIEAYLVRIAHNKSIDIIRKRKNHILLEQSHIGSHPSHDESLDTEELWNTVAGLPEKQRLAIAYHYFGGLTHNQSAEILGSSAASVRRAAADAMKKLRKIIDSAERSDHE